jgi:hypothetical protein
VSFSFSSFVSLLAIFLVLQSVGLNYHVNQFSRHISGPKVYISFSRFSVFLVIFQIIQCFCLLFHVFQFCHNNTRPIVCISHISRFSLSHHIPDPKVCVSHFARFSVFFSIFHVLPCEFLIFLVFQFFSPYYRSYNVSFSLSLLISVLAIFHVLKCAFLIFHVFQCFSPYSRSCSVCVSFFTFISFLATIQFLQCVFFVLHLFTVSRHIPGPTVCVSHLARFSVLLAIFNVLPWCFSFSSFVHFLAIFQVLQCEFLIFHVFKCSRSYIVCVSFSMFFSFLTTIQVQQCVFLFFFTHFSVSRHITSSTVCVSNFARFSVFLAIFQVLPCEFLIFLVCQIYRQFPGHTVFVSHFPHL